MRKRQLKNLGFRKRTVANLTQIRGGDLIPLPIIRTQFEGCFSLIGYYTCETGLQPTCHHSYRSCPQTEIAC
ncbi:hypothetical protein ACJD0Z_11255 [Flavobacteriaceae bacterium M23B6Z8]